MEEQQEDGEMVHDDVWLLNPETDEPWTVEEANDAEIVCYPQPHHNID